MRPTTPISIEDAGRIVDKFVSYYNEKSLHLAIGYVAPKDKLLGRDAEIFAERDRKIEAAREGSIIARRSARRAALLIRSVE